jgi:signal transduction histidine kinase
MKDFSHPNESKEPVDINRAIRTTLTVAKNEWKYVADIETDLAEDLPQVPCIRSAINQVVLNLVVNAAHAIGDVVSGDQKGTIGVRTAVSGPNATIEIWDTGSGIPKDIVERIFDPYFTTKEVGKGTGQGLGIVYNVIKERHGGTITVDSEVGKGTRFVLSLPLETECGASAS